LLLKVFTADRLVRGTEFAKKVPASWETWKKSGEKELKARLLKLSTQRRELLDAKTDLEMKGKTLSPDQQRLLAEADFESDLGSLEEILRRYDQRPWEKLKADLRQRDRNKLFRLVTYAAKNVLVWARNERVAGVRHLWPALPPAPIEEIDLLATDAEQGQEAAVKMALRNRWDLMNARGQVVDAWRQLAVTANALLGVLNVQYHLDSSTPPGGT